jgi:hypothetical protein
VTAVRAIEAIPVPDRLGAGQHLVLEVGGAQPAAGRREVEQDAGPQRRVGDDEPPRRRFRQQRPVDEQRRHERFRLDRREAETIDQLFLVAALDRVAEREERVARHRLDAVRRLAVEDLRRRESHVTADHDHVGDPAERDLAADFVDDVRDRSFQQ